MPVSGPILEIHYHYGSMTISAINNLLANTLLSMFFSSEEPLGMLQARSVHREPITTLAFPSWATPATRFFGKLDKTNHWHCNIIQYYWRGNTGLLADNAIGNCIFL